MSEPRAGDRGAALEALQETLATRFRDTELLAHALRHRSAADEPAGSNERLEFLGDSIVGMVVCDYLFRTFPGSPEGDLAKAKAFLVSEPTLAEAGLALGLHHAIEMSAAEEAAGGLTRPSMVSDAFEAVVGAVYMDQGVRSARRVVRAALRGAMRRVARNEYNQDYKSALQERMQAHSRTTPQYRIASETGADHDKTFVAQVLLHGRVLGAGAGKTKKQAEQEAARAVLDAGEAGDVGPGERG